MDQDLERCRSAVKTPMSTSAEESSVTFGDDGGWGEYERQVWMMVEGGIARSHPSASSSQAIGVQVVRGCEGEEVVYQDLAKKLDDCRRG